ncbi:class I SAM-dependent methyltransferase [Pontixanthobacter gangjinensis]|uniref:Class I SAM-dependent methyltransferase n=1 Tax=Christiangramia aestuarii TaxID=1028746 RepID=A0A7M3SXS7_9FLAO|nr:class I SAM-dependent methyltransferase [Christiangramia aestuarii]MUP41408.1 class I SAM-dependent methyltransferase [Christiangramia aestuarii]
MDKNKDIFGNAIKAFYEENDRTNINVHSPDFDDDIIPTEYLFRDFNEMPKIEQKALLSCQGKVLDVGCGAGSHALYLQKNENLKVHAIDTSPGAIEIARKRGVVNASCQDFFSIENEKFNTILMLMNGSGIIGKLENLKNFFNHCKSLLKEGGKILMDSSDLIYLFDDEIEASEKYYGEFEFRVSYKEETSESFDWLYIDPELLEKYASENGFETEILITGENYEYLACLKIK